MVMKVSICVGSACHLKGSYAVVSVFKKMIENENLGDTVELNASFCLGQCSNDGVSVKINDEIFFVKPEDAENFFKNEIMKRD